MSKTKEYLSFFLAAVAKPWKIGAVVPSSRELAETMLQRLPFGTTESVVEIGPGTGAITELILARLKDPSQYLGLEINPDFIETLKKRFPGVTFQQDSAENLVHHFKDKKGPDYIVCSLPWTMWSDKQQSKLLNNILEPLVAGGTFVTYAYWPTFHAPAGQKFKKLLGRTVSKMEVSPIVWKNIPPAVTISAQSNSRQICFVKSGLISCVISARIESGSKYQIMKNETGKKQRR